MQKYCVYNHSNECFLSLGATLGDRAFKRLKQWLGLNRRRADEGCWISPYDRSRAITFFTARDLLYLDSSQRVVHMLESHPALRTVPPRADAVTLLALPVHTVASSHTTPGNQLLICAAEEMERRLRKLFHREPPPRPVMTVSASPEPAQDTQPVLHLARKPAVQTTVHTVPANAVEIGSATHGVPNRKTERIAAPVAYYAEGGQLAVHAIRDLSATGLFLVTRDRWPVGSEVKMSLQPCGNLNATTTAPITVRMRVTRWGADGVDLEFSGAPAEASELKSLYVC